MDTTMRVSRRTLLDAVAGSDSPAMQAALVLGASGLVALSARLTIPLPFVPITGQTFAVLLVSAALGSRRAALAMLAYLAEGLAGFPVFASAHSAWSPSAAGLPTIIGPTAGYLFAFPVVGLVVGFLAERGWDRSVGRAIPAMLAGEIIIYLGGVTWLARFVGLAGAVQAGLLPFVAGDILKLALAAATLPAAWALLGRRSAASHPQ